MVELPLQHTQGHQPADRRLEESQAVHHRESNRTSNFPLTTDFYEIWFFEAVVFEKPGQNWANRSEVERVGQTLCMFLVVSCVRLQLICCVIHITKTFGGGGLTEDKPHHTIASPLCAQESCSDITTSPRLCYSETSLLLKKEAI